jgi:hypothetical protein
MIRGYESPAAFIGAGALAGALSTFVFTVIHQLLISSIWFAFPVMLLAGALCGTCLAWSYTRVVATPTAPSWLLYNLFYLVMFVALGIASMAAFTPETTIAALLKAKDPPYELIGRALPVTGVFTLVTAALLSLFYRSGRRGAGGILVTAAVLVLVLGLNISVLGFVAVPGRTELGVLFEVFALLLAIMGVYAAAVLALGWSRSRSPVT